MEKQNDQEVEETLDLPAEVAAGEEDATDWKAEAQKLQQKAIKQREKTKEYKAKLKTQEEAIALMKPKEELKKPNEQSNEPDYARLAFLEQRGLTNPDDQKLVQDEAARLKMPLTDILGMDHIKSKLKEAKDQREASAGMPKGKGRSGGSNTQQDVDFWIDQKNSDGSFKTPDDQELAGKVIAARIKKEKQGNKFSDIMFTG